MITMKKTIIIAAALCLSLPGVKAWAQEEEPAPRSLVHISLITPLGTNGLESWNTVNHLSLNLFAGYSGGLDGLEVAGFANALKGDMRGIQVAGFCNNTFGDADGFEIAGFWNYNHRNVKGMQIAGFANLTRGTMEGIQVSGFINYAKVVKGLQIGYINIADTIESGMPIGFISFVKDGYRVVQIGGNETFMGEISYKSGIERFYNIFTTGATIHRNSLIWGWGYGVGTILPVHHRVDISMEAIAYHVNRNRFFTGYTSLLNKLNMTVNLHLNRHLTLYGGPSFNVSTTDRDHYESPLSDRWIVYERNTRWHTVAMYPGWTVGVRMTSGYPW